MTPLKGLLFILPFLAHAAFAQSDSLKHAVDSIKVVEYRLDSLERSFQQEIDSFKRSYAIKKAKIVSEQNHYQHAIDSLSKLKLPTDLHTKKLDSLNHDLTMLQRDASSKIDSLKNKVTANLQTFKGSSTAITSKVSSLTASMDKINVPSIDADLQFSGIGKLSGTIPGIPVNSVSASLPSGNLPGNLPTATGKISNINASVPSVPDLGVQSSLEQAKDITGKVGDVQQQLKDGVTLEKAEEVIEKQASGLEPIKALETQSGIPTLAPANGEEAKEQLKDMAKKQAVDHFAGKEATLQQAMEKMSKYKQKYNSVSSIKDLPDKRPNPMKEKPFVERLIPGITLQFQSQQYWMVDVYGSMGFRFTEHINAGLGWNQRWAYSAVDNDFSPSARIYGVRSYGEYEFKKGFAPRLEVECMNTEVSDVMNSTETTRREWVWSAFVGIKQEYRITKNLRGNGQILYNLFDPHYKSPYGDRINVRIGVEYVIRKKMK